MQSTFVLEHSQNIEKQEAQNNNHPQSCHSERSTAGIWAHYFSVSLLFFSCVIFFFSLNITEITLQDMINILLTPLSIRIYHTSMALQMLWSDYEMLFYGA